MKFLAIVMFAGCVLTSCNTFIGVGRDFRMLGQGLENKAQGQSFDGGRAEQQENEENAPTY